MSRSRNRKRKQKKEERKQEVKGDLVKETAATFTCIYEIARDFTHQCKIAREDLETDIVFNQVAYDLWRDRPGNPEILAAALADFLSERRRYLAAVKMLEERFQTFLNPPIHEHLDPVEQYYEQIHRGLFPHEFDSPESG